MFKEACLGMFFSSFFYDFGEPGTEIYFSLDYKLNQKSTRGAWVDIPGVIKRQSSGIALKSIWI